MSLPEQFLRIVFLVLMEILFLDYTAKSLKHDSAQKARDARREIFEEREVLISVPGFMT